MLLSGDGTLAEDGVTPGARRRALRGSASQPNRRVTGPASASATTSSPGADGSVPAGDSPAETRAPSTDTAAASGGDFRSWRKQRPFIGGLLVALGGVEMFFSGQLDIGHLHVQLGIEGFQATVIPLALFLLGILAMTMPDHHVFYGIIALALALYSLVGVNLGGFLVGMLLAGTGGVLVAAWMKRSPDPQGEPAS